MEKGLIERVYELTPMGRDIMGFVKGTKKDIRKIAQKYNISQKEVSALTVVFLEPSAAKTLGYTDHNQINLAYLSKEKN